MQKTVPKWHLLGYNRPPGCEFLELKYARMSNQTQELCSTEIDLISKLNITYEEGTFSKMTVCEVDLNKSHRNITALCKTEFTKTSMNENDYCANAETNSCCEELGQAQACQRWNVYDWLLTIKPGVFGLAKGWANVTGGALITILTIMVICSLPIVRQSGHFQVFQRI